MILLTTTAFAQTKKIEHRSHSGSDKTFATTTSSNFGLSPEVKKRWDSTRKINLQKDSIEKARKADSIKRANPKKAVVKGKGHKV